MDSLFWKSYYVLEDSSEEMWKKKKKVSWPFLLHVQIVRIQPQVAYNEERGMAYEYNYVCLLDFAGQENAFY